MAKSAQPAEVLDSTDYRPIALAIVSAVFATIALQFIVSGALANTTGEGLHLPRRLQHCLTGVLFLGISYTPLVYDYRFVVSGLLFGCSVIVYGLHLWRLGNKDVYEFLAKSYASILREKELNGGIPGAFFFLLGVGVTALIVESLAFFDEIELERGLLLARLAIVNLSFGDPIAAIAGTILTSPEKRGSKSIWGSLACFCVCFALGNLLGADVLLSLASAILAALSERLSFIDDNFSIPVISIIGLLAYDRMFH